MIKSNIQHIPLPPISHKFYKELQRVFPPIHHSDIKSSTDLITIQRKAAEQGVLEFIKRNVRYEDDTYSKFTFLQRLKYVLFNK